jgi:hypothetical protein
MLIITHQLTSTINNYLLVAIGDTDATKGLTTLEHPKYGKYYCNNRGELCFPEGRPWNIPGWLLHTPDPLLLDLLQQTPNQEVFKVGELYFTDRVHAEDYEKNPERRVFLTENYTVLLEA